MSAVATLTFFAPPGGCRVNAAAAFEAAASGTGYVDFGSSDRYQIQMKEFLADTTTFVTSEASALKPVSGTRAKYTDLFTSSYAIAAGRWVEVSLFISTATSHTMTVWNADLRVEIIKR